MAAVVERASTGASARDQRYNFAVLTLDGLLFWLGISYYSPTTILPLFVSHLTASNVLVGAVPSIVFLCWALPQLAGARALGREQTRKWYIVRTALLGRVPLLALVLATALLAADRPRLTLALFFVCFGLFRLTGGLNTPAYYDLVAAAIHPRVRARFIGLSQFLGGAIGAAGLFMGRAALDAFPFPGGFVLCFALGLVCLTAAIGVMAMVREPELRPRQRGQPLPGGAALLSDLRQVLAADAALRRYLTGRALLALGSMAAAFFAVHAVRDLGASDGDVALFTSLVLASQTVSTLLWGAVADRLRLEPVLLAAAALTALAAAVALAAPSLAWFSLVFGVVGAATGALAVTDAGMPLALAEASECERTQYVALANTVLAPFQITAPLLGGLAADLGGYAVTYAASLALSVVACAVIVRGTRPA